MSYPQPETVTENGDWRCPSCGGDFDPRGYRLHANSCTDSTHTQSIGDTHQEQEPEDTEPEQPHGDTHTLDLASDQNEKPSCPNCGADDVRDAERAASVYKHRGAVEIAQEIQQRDWYCNSCMTCY